MVSNVPPQCRELAQEVEALEAVKETLQNHDRGGGFDPTPGGFDQFPRRGVPRSGGPRIRGRLTEIDQELRERRRELDTCIEAHAADVPTEAEQAIEEKRTQLERAGRGLGSPKGDVEGVGHGGSVRVFERGRIYWHPHSSIGAHEVHGGILQKYLEMGGPGRNPDTGRRDLKFPVSDETRARDDRCPVSHFEEGSIYWLGGIGGVAIYGTLAEEWARRERGRGRLGYPVCDPVEGGGGTCVYFEGGCLWVGENSGLVREFRFTGDPLLGKQTIVDPESNNDLVFGSAIRLSTRDVFRDHVDIDVPGKPIGPDDEIPLPDPRDMDDAIDQDAKRAVEQLGETLWNERLVLRPATDADAQEIPLTAAFSHLTSSHVGQAWQADLHFDLGIPDPELLVEGTPYDVVVRLPDGGDHRLFSHAVLAAADPDVRRSDIVFTEEEVEVVGTLRVKPARDGTPTIQFDPIHNDVHVGGAGQSADLTIRNGSGEDRIHLDGESGDIHLPIGEEGASTSLQEALQGLERRIAALEE